MEEELQDGSCTSSRQHQAKNHQLLRCHSAKREEGTHESQFGLVEGGDFLLVGETNYHL